MANNTSDLDNDKSSDSLIGVRTEEAARVTFAVIGCVMIFSGVFGNISLIVIVVKHFKRNHKRPLQDLFIVNLAICDLLTLGYWFVFFVLDMVLGYHPVANGSHCTANGMIISLLFMVRMNSIVIIWFNRYLHVCHNHLYRRVFTLARTVFWFVFIWVFSLLLCLTPFWGGPAGLFTYNPTIHACSYSRKGFAYPKVMFILYSGLSPILIVYFNAAIFRFWRRARLSLTSRYPLSTKRQKGKRPLTAMWKARTSVPGTVAEEMSLEPEFQPHHQNPLDLSAHSLQTVDVYLLTQQTVTLSRKPSTLSRNTDEITPSRNDAASSEVMTSTCPELHRQDATSNPNTDDSRNICQSEGNCSAGESEDHQEEMDDCLRTEGDPSGASEFQDQSQTCVEDVKLTLGSQAEETDGCGSAVVDGSSSTTPSLPSVGLTLRRKAEQRTSPTRRNQQKQGLAILNLQIRLRKKSQNKEATFVRSLLVTCTLMFLFLVPYGVVLVVDYYVKQPVEVHVTVIIMFYLNNAMDWIVYGVMNPAFKNAYVEYIWLVLNACRRSKV